MATDYQEGGSNPIEGRSRSPEEISKEELLAFTPTSERPDWMVTRFPVSMEEYRRLEMEARAPDLTRAMAAPGEPVPQADPERADTTTTGAVGSEAGEGETLAATSSATGPEVTAPTTGANFGAFTQTPWQPPDCTIAVGPNDVMVAVNTDLAVYGKNGALKFRWANMTTLFGSALPQGASIFDPKVAYDHYSQRWIVVAAARRNSPQGSWIMLGVSQGPNPAGSYWVWALDATLNGSAATNNWADYPMLGFDTQGIYIALNMFAFAGGFQYSKLRILSKAEVYAGGVGPNHFIKWYDLWDMKNPDGSASFTMQPAIHFRGLGGNPNAYLANALWPKGNTLIVWTLSNPIGYWIGGSASLSKTAVSCIQYDLPPDGLQPGTTTRIETNDDRLLNAIFQNVGGVQRLWTTHTSRFTWQGDSEARSAVQWYEIDIPTMKVVQQNAFGQSGAYYFYPAIQTDVARNAFVVFGRCKSTEFAQLRQTGRKVGDAANTLQGSALVKAGASAYTGGRWGDYFGICRDGGASNTVWMHGEYAGNGNTWATQACSTKF